MTKSVVIIVCAFLVFAFTHSILVADKTKVFVEKLIGQRAMRRYYRFFFTIFSLTTLLITAYIVLGLPDREIVRIQSPFDLVFRAFQFLGIVLLVLAGKHFDFFEFIGIKQILKSNDNHDIDIEGLKKSGLITTGVYGIVRHPMYLAGILIFTFNPVITVNSIVITIMADCYLIFGAWIESKRYMNLYGKDYKIYSQRVPMLFPLRIWTRH